MVNVQEIVTTVSKLAVKLLDYYSELLSTGVLRTLLAYVMLLLLVALAAVSLKTVLYLLTRPFLHSVCSWAATLQLFRKEEAGAPKPYVLHMRLSMREIFRAALSDVGLFGRTDTDALLTVLVRRSRSLSEDANFGSVQGMVKRSDILRKQSNRYVQLVRSLEKERAGRLYQPQEYFAEASHLEELELPSHSGDMSARLCFGLFASMMFQSEDYHAFRNIIRSGSIRPEGTVMRFHTEAAREHFADKMQRSLSRGVPYIVFNWLRMPGKGMRLSVMRYLFKSANTGKLDPLENEKGPGYEIRFDSEQGRQQASFRFEIISSSPVLHRRLLEYGTREIMSWAAGKATLEGLVLGNILPIEVGGNDQRQILSEKYRLDNPFDRNVLADLVCRFVALQADTVGGREQARVDVARGGQP